VRTTLLLDLVLHQEVFMSQRNDWAGWTAQNSSVWLTEESIGRETAAQHRRTSPARTSGNRKISLQGQPRSDSSTPGEFPAYQPKVLETTRAGYLREGSESPVLRFHTSQAAALIDKALRYGPPLRWDSPHWNAHSWRRAYRTSDEHSFNVEDLLYPAFASRYAASDVLDFPSVGLLIGCSPSSDLLFAPDSHLARCFNCHHKW